ncbi:UNVERIFIED_CONTAM: hypothetical protein GTU68_029620 [Idotea baltica]|nr:hypothetical protein [Idotea baltica]
MASSLRTEVLSLYRKILRTCARWEAKEPSQTPREKSYILAEVRELFRKNKHVSEEGRILQCLQEGEARLEMGNKTAFPNLFSSLVIVKIGVSGFRLLLLKLLEI